MKNRMIDRSAVLRKVSSEEDQRTAEFVISSEKVDSYNTIFRKDGWMLDNYIKNSIVTYNHSLHSNDPDNIIGTSEVFFDGDLLIGRVTFESEDVNPLAEKIFKKINAGTLKMASVGARIHEASFGDKEKGEDPNILYFNKAELIEWSVVPAGANKDAHKRNEECITEIRKEITPTPEDSPLGGDAEGRGEEERSVFEAQLIINKNRVK